MAPSFAEAMEGRSSRWSIAKGERRNVMSEEKSWEKMTMGEQMGRRGIGRRVFGWRLMCAEQPRREI